MEYSYVLIFYYVLITAFGSTNFYSSTATAENWSRSLDVNNAPLWLVNLPSIFEGESKLGELFDNRQNSEQMKFFSNYIDEMLPRIDGFTDGECIDALEHFFWGMTNGLAIELGALDGSPKSRSMTYDYEDRFSWNRILIEGNPRYREDLRKNSPKSFAAVAAICEKHMQVHFKPVEYVGGILEFMSIDFLKSYHKTIYDAGNPPGNVSSINWEMISENVLIVDCMPMAHILHKAKVNHVNYFILDVEGGEIEVLKSINWEFIMFDVLCIETEINNRPVGYAESVISFLADKGYKNVTGQMGRNTWFTRNDFIPSVRPGINQFCYNGARKSENADQWWLDRRTPPFVKCQMATA